jgi:hypothetical protein
MSKVDMSPSPEFMEAYGRAREKHGTRAGNYIREELDLMAKNHDSICARLADDQAKHAALAARYPALYGLKPSGA